MTQKTQFPSSSDPCSKVSSSPLMDSQKEEKKLCILQVLPALHSGGVERGTIDLALFLQKEGHTPLVLSKGGPLVKRLLERKLEHIKRDVSTKNPLKIIKNAFFIKKIIKEKGVHVIHGRSRAPAWSALLAAKMTGTPFVTTFHGCYNFPEAFIVGFFKRLYNSVMVRGDRVIAISEFIQDHVQTHYKAFLKKGALTLVNRGVDTLYFNPLMVAAERRRALRKKWYLNPNEKVILVPGRLTRWKGQKVVLEALKKVLPHHPRVTCVFIGSDQGRIAYREELEAFARENDLYPHVYFAGNISDMPAAYALGDIVLHASTDPEAFGRVIIEAQAMKVPIIASDIGAPALTIKGGGEEEQTGWLHRAGDSQDLANVLLDVLSLSCDQREKVTENAFKELRAHYTDKILFQKTCAVYRELADLSA